MRHVKLFEAFSTISLTEDQKIWLDKCAKGGWSLNPLTGLVDVDVDFYCAGQRLRDFKGVAFGHVKGNFNCSNNRLTSLNGAPQTIGSGFYCGANSLTSLEGAPKPVNGDFACGNNQLTSLEGAPKTVGGSFFCYSNQLTSLTGAPKTVNAVFSCSDNQLTSLIGAPQIVGRSFYCDNNQLTSLDGAPKTVNGDFNCSGNQLTSLVGAPETVDVGFRCADNPLKSLVGAPESVGRFKISVWDSDPGIRALDWYEGWDKKDDKEFTKTLISKLKEINALGSDANKGKSVSMLLSLAGQHFDLLEYLLSLRLSTSDKFETYGAIKANMPDVWNKIKAELDPEGDTSDLLDLGF